MSRAWRIRLSEQAESDVASIARWTTENFGARQAEQYTETLILAIEALTDGPEILGTEAREEIARDMRVLHVARQGRKGRHFIVFRAVEGQVIEILRLLHDSMELSRHIPMAIDQAH